MEEDDNGWSNRDTWLANLWLTNDYIAQSVFDREMRVPKPNLPYSWRELSEKLKNFPGDEVNLKNVNWDEIIKNHQDS